MPTENDIIAFLIRNATPEAYLPVESPSEGDFDDHEPYIKKVLLRLAGVTRYTVPLQAFEAFMGEPYSFESHLRAIHDSGALNFAVAKAGDFYDTPKYRKSFDRSNGLVCNYDVPGRPCWIVFTLGKEDATDVAVKMYFQVLANLKTLGVKLPVRRRNKK